MPLINIPLPTIANNQLHPRTLSSSALSSTTTMDLNLKKHPSDATLFSPATSAAPLATSSLVPVHSPNRPKPLWVIPLVLCLVALAALIGVLCVLGKKKKLGRLNPYQNPYFRRMKREAQIERCAKGEVDQRERWEESAGEKSEIERLEEFQKGKGGVETGVVEMQKGHTGRGNDSLDELVTRK